MVMLVPSTSAGADGKTSLAVHPVVSQDKEGSIAGAGGGSGGVRSGSRLGPATPRRHNESSDGAAGDGLLVRWEMTQRSVLPASASASASTTSAAVGCVRHTLTLTVIGATRLPAEALDTGSIRTDGPWAEHGGGEVGGGQSADRPPRSSEEMLAAAPPTGLYVRYRLPGEAEDQLTPAAPVGVAHPSFRGHSAHTWLLPCGVPLVVHAPALSDGMAFAVCRGSGGAGQEAVVARAILQPGELIDLLDAYGGGGVCGGPFSVSKACVLSLDAPTGGLLGDGCATLRVRIRYDCEPVLETATGNSIGGEYAVSVIGGGPERRLRGGGGAVVTVWVRAAAGLADGCRSLARRLGSGRRGPLLAEGPAAYVVYRFSPAGCPWDPVGGGGDGKAGSGGGDAWYGGGGDCGGRGSGGWFYSTGVAAASFSPAFEHRRGFAVRVDEVCAARRLLRLRG
jgi:hypothetical protein